jgi:beta-galactosidase GanA
MIIYGTQYYRPPFPDRSCWKADLLKIKEVHFNTVKLWAVWSWIERSEGNFYFPDLDEIISLCQETGLNVCINIIPEGAPYWFIRRHPEARYTNSQGFCVDASGAANLPSGGSPGLCADTPEVEQAVCTFITKVVERYSGRENVTAFDVWNEPHIEPIWDFPNQLFCYCDGSKKRFVEWLKARYQDIGALNSAWMRAYQGWEDVSPPVRYGTYPDMIDWRLFWLENLGTWLDSRVSAARLAGNGKTIMTHVPFSGYFGGSGEGGLGYHLGDEFLLAPRVDAFGLTSFPKWLMDNDHVQHLMNLEFISAACPDKDFWQSELQAGAGKWEAYGRPVAAPQEIRLWNWSALASGAKGILYWQWKPEPSGMEAPGFGLTALDGSLSPRVEQAAKCAQVFNHQKGLGKARRIPCVNGIFVSRSADLFWHAAFNGEPLYARSLFGAYKACFEAGIPVRMVHADHLNEIQPGELQTLYLPAAISLAEVEMDSLAAFVRNGGTLVSEACPGLFDEHGVIRREQNFLEELFGLSGLELDHQEKVVIKYPDGLTNSDAGQVQGIYYRQDFLHVRPDVSIQACFEDGRPAVFESSFGKGRAILAGTFVSIAAGLSENASSRRFVTRWMDPSGYSIVKRLQTGEKTLFRLHRESSRIYITAVNYSLQPQIFRAEFNFDFRLVDAPGGKILSHNPREILSTLEPQDGVIITLERLPVS